MTRRRRDPKLDALQQAHALHAHADKVCDALFKDSRFFDPRDVVQVKYEMLRRVRVDHIPVARVARAFGFSRPAYYQAQSAFDRAGLLGLVPQKRGPRRAHKLSALVVKFLQETLAEDASQRPAALAIRVRERFKIVVHPRSIERALARTGKV
jgi:transposase